MYDGIIFDKDGVLLDSGIDNFKWMDRIRIETAREMGIKFTEDDARRLVHSTSPEDVQVLLDKHNMTWEQLKTVEEAKEVRKRQLMVEGEIQLFAPVKKLLREMNIEKTIVSNAPKETTEFTVDHFQIRDHFESIKSPSMSDMKQFYRRKKPKPVMIREAMEETGLENPVMIGDSNSDIVAAQNVGIDSIHVRSYWDEIDATPTYSIRDISELKEIFD